MKRKFCPLSRQPWDIGTGFGEIMVDPHSEGTKKPRQSTRKQNLPLSRPPPYRHEERAAIGEMMVDAPNGNNSLRSHTGCRMFA